MRQYYNIPENLKDDFMNMQIEAWRARIELFKAIKPIIKAYDGKTYSKRLDQAIEEKYNTRENRNEYAYISHSYGERLYITIRTNRSLTIPGEHYDNHEQINDPESSAGIHTYIPEGSKLRRVDAAQTIKNIDASIEGLHDKIEKTIKAYANISKYRELVNQAQDLIREASELISGAPSELTGLYKLEYCIKESRY